MAPTPSEAAEYHNVVTCCISECDKAVSASIAASRGELQQGFGSYLASGQNSTAISALFCIASALALPASLSLRQCTRHTPLGSF